MLNIARRSARGSETPAGAARVDIDQVHRRFDGPDVLGGVSLHIAAGESMVLLGPSGCGKTTLLRAIAGLERLDGGCISIDGEVVSGPERHVHPEDRRVGMVFQDWALFPHLTVTQNVAFGLDRDERRSSRVEETLELVGLAGLGERRPSTLSGGQQQRVALARALAPRPRVLLLDEPFSNLDTGLRARIRTEASALLRSLDITAIYVTHDQDEAFVLGDRIAVMMAGSIIQVGTPSEIYDHPSTAAVSDFVGETNRISGVLGDVGAETSVGLIPVASTGSLGDRLQILVRPEHLMIEPDSNADSVVESIEYYGHDHICRVRLGRGGMVTTRAAMAPRVSVGESVTVRYSGPGSAAFVAD